MTEIVPDVLGPPYEAETLTLTPDLVAPVEAVLVRRLVPGARGAMLYLHGYNDYFFHTELADRMVDQGWSVYALDLRRCGRALRPGQLAGFVGDISVYFEEVGSALTRIRDRDGHETVWMNAHSTGGLVATRYAQCHPHAVEALVLNAPYLDVPSMPLQGVLEGLAAQVCRVAPRLPLRQRLFPYYGWSLHRPDGPKSPYRGEWTFNTEWKRIRGMHYPPGWLVATREAQRAAWAASPLPMPVLVLTSQRYHRGLRWSEAYRTADVVLDVARVRARAAELGPRVDQEALDGALHDVWLSSAAVRERAYERVAGWLDEVLEA